MAKEAQQKVITKKHLARLEKERQQRKYILIASISVLALVVLLVGYGLVEQAVIKPAQPVAKVNGEGISSRDFQARVRYQRLGVVQQYNQTAQFAQMFGSDASMQSYFESSLQQIQQTLADPVTFGQSVLDEMVDDVLVRQEAKKLGLTVTKEELEKRLQQDFGFYADGTPTPLPTEATQAVPTLSAEQLALITATPTPTATLAATPEPTQALTATQEVTATSAVTPTAIPLPTLTPTPYTEDLYKNDYKTYLETLASAAQVTEAEFRAIYEGQLLREKVLAEVTKEISSDQQQFWIRHIVLGDNAAAQAVYEEIQAGGDFGELASLRSTDTLTKDQGGDLGWQIAEELDAVVSQTALNMNIGDISEPIQTADGFEIIQLLGKDVRPVSSTQLDQLKQNTFTDWLAGVRGTATIETFETWKDIVPTEPSIQAGV